MPLDASPTAGSSRGRRVVARLLVILLSLAGSATLPVVATTPASAAADVGYRDFSYGSGTSAPTAEKAQSKLWFAGGSWWGALYNSSATDFHIYRLDWATQTWSDTGVLVDARPHVKIDTLWTGTHLYVAAAGQSSSSSGDSPQITRYTLTNGQFSRDPGYPVTLVTGGMDSIVIDQDSTGRLWATWVRGSSVYVTHSTTADTSWVTPYVLPVPGANDVKAEPDGDSSTLVSFGGKIGVLWGNQNASSPSGNSYWFAIHRDGTDDSAASWTRELAYGGVPSDENADDHMNIKSLQSDAEGRIFAAVKTSLNNSTDPLVVLLVRQPDGTWDRDNVYGRAGENHTRAIVLLDDENDDAHVLAAAPCCSGGVVYHKKVSFQALANGNPFANGLGAPFISSSLDTAINNPTSTKQTLSSATGLVVLAGDDGSHMYLHNKLDLAGASTVPDTTLLSGPAGTVGSTTAEFTFTATYGGATFECALDGLPFAPCTSPKTYSGVGAGAHQFQVRAISAAGTDPTPATGSWTVDLTLPVTVSPAADANVQSRSPSRNFGTATQLLADASPQEESYLQFDVPANAPTVTSAKLRLFVTNGSTNGPAIHSVPDQSWTESGITWSTKPARSTTALDNKGTLKTNTWVEYDVTRAVTTPGLHSFALVADSGDGTVASAREAATNRPQLVVSYPADSTAPAVTARSPQDGAAAVAVDEPVTATFSEPMNEASLAQAVTLTGPSGAVPGTLTYDAGSRTATLTPGADLVGSTTYTAAVSTSATDLAGNPLAAAVSWTFTTATVVDTTPPDTSITGGPSGTVRTTEATFELAASEDGSTFTCSLDGAAAAPCTSPVTYASLAEGEHTLTATATDAAGNTDASPASRSWDVDLTAPAVTAQSPQPDATGVPVTGTVVTATFSEAMDEASLAGAVTLTGPSGAVPGAITYDAASRTVTLTPSGTLAGGTAYTAAVSTAATDLVGNPLAAAVTWSFVTATPPPPPSGPIDDDFESGAFGKWSTVRLGGDGTAAVLATGGLNGTAGASLSATVNTGSLAYIRKTFESTADLTVDLDVTVTKEGLSGANVPLLRLFDPSGRRVLSVFRQNLASNRVYVSDGSANVLTSGTLPLNRWSHLTVAVTGAGTGSATIQVQLDGVTIHSVSASAMGSVGALQIGNETAKQAFALTADNVRATIP
ncbi:Ig-like domain-containing protein [Actinotalea sp. Marseille-Q4924]|uniref:Ig-like domain-containing protein n=1 Tax=Actinotalea sp. Marseille-Q4924 TaxID=2866571 RepID=UPI001CE3F18E|nr:Ig-like domain-containing protein [Actinotalea sp. Marseille-Q4924]